MKNRQSSRLVNYDYSQNGMYFVTICTKNREHLFGEIVSGKIILNDAGKITNNCWLDIPNHFPDISLDKFVVMPNHVHGIIEIINDDLNVGNAHVRSLQNLRGKNLSMIALSETNPN